MRKKGRKLSAKDKEILELLEKGREQYEEYLRWNDDIYFTLLRIYLKKKEKIVYEPPSFDNPLTTDRIKVEDKKAHKKNRKISDKDKEALEFYQRAKKQYDDFFKRNGHLNFIFPRQVEEIIYPSPSPDAPLKDDTIKIKKIPRKKSNKLSAKDKEILELLRKAREEYLRKNSHLRFSLPKKKEEEIIYEPPSLENPLTDHRIKIDKKDAYLYPPLNLKKL